ncbi:peptidase M48 [Acinetobacter sp. MD2(2019)]|uniref:peptidase M48 n=1 Tax=Acinetobacter sp. MD2(2019) TaxID=2605273 RepID=UPI002D1E8DF8|nr:peptidase M48 [Acinetobacter sp. MD2(2019)]MEB3752782.1 peptidase M48 [Acinetobacter sp. MD2(2019)]
MAANTFFSHHQKNLFWPTAICLVAILITLIVLNFSFGLFVHYLEPEQSVFWYSFSPIVLLVILGIMTGSVLYEVYVFREGGHSLAKQLHARYVNALESTPEEIAAIKIIERFAQQFNVKTPSLYVLPDEVGVNALTAGVQASDTVIIITWGALQNLDELELYGLFSYAFYQILSGETQQNTRLKILFSSLTTFNQLGSNVARLGFKPYHQKKQNKFETILVALGGIIWLMGSMGLFISRLIKFITLSGRTFKNDDLTSQMIDSEANIQTLLRIYVHHAGSQIHSPYSESVAHMCFANSLSPQSWLNIHPSIERRIYELNPSLLEDLQLENLKKLRSQPWSSLFTPFDDENTPEIHLVWSAPQPLPLLRLSPISFSMKDAIKPLNPSIRANMVRPEQINRALQTATGSREVLVAILMIRQYREYIPKDAPVSQALIDALLSIDGRQHVQIFYDACDNIQTMPASFARQFLTKLAYIVQADGEIGLLDGLLLERVKYQLDLLPERMPAAYDEVLPEVIRLMDALLHVQQINSSHQLEAREKMLTQLLKTENLEQYQDISDEPIDLGEILQDLSGLLLRDRLKILGIAEQCLWNDRVITQDELDMLQLLYWRLGFNTDEIVDHILKKNSIMIV